MNKETLNNVLSDYINSYTTRDTSDNFPDWFAGRLKEDMPDLSTEESKKLSEEIIGGVADYDKSLVELNKAIDAGQSKEEC